MGQKVIDARLTKKSSESFYGYKDHANVDQDTKLIIAWEVTSAEVHDSQVLEVLQSTEAGGANVCVDSACPSNALEENLAASSHTSHIHEKGARNYPLTEAQRSSNKEKSQVRAQVEHVYGSMTNELGGITICTIGYGRAKEQIGLLSLVYNIKRVAILIRKGCFSFDRSLRPKLPKRSKNERITSRYHLEFEKI